MMGHLIRSLTGKGHREAEAEKIKRDGDVKFNEGMFVATTYLTVSEKLVRQLQEDIPR